MTGVFSGGLAYEFTEEPNNYGLIEVNGTTAQMLPDFVALQSQYSSVQVSEGTVAPVTRPTTCPPASSYANLNGTNDLPETPAANLIQNGISSSLYSAGKLITPSNWLTTYTIKDQNGNVITSTSIDSSGYSATNPPNGGAGTSGSQIGGTNSTTSDAGQLRFNEALIGALAVGVVAWNGLA
jgi:Glucanosyltransferase